MAAEVLQVGPFVGGINSQSDPSAIGDEELVDCLNFESDLDGSLIVRPPIQTVTSIGITGTKRLLLLGSTVIGGVEYVIGSNDGGVFYRVADIWNLITSTFEAAAMVQYDNKVWLVPKIGSANSGGSWDGTTFTADADIPQGGAAVVYKERMFVAPGFDATTNDSRLRFSDAGLFGNWPANNFVDIARGDGQKLVDLVVFRSNLICFKNASTYYLAYDGTPFDAVIEQISPVIGPSHPYCVTPYENSYFLYQEGRIYELLNFAYEQANIKVPFAFDGTAPSTRSENATLATIGDRLVVRHFNRIYNFGLRTRTWSRWRSDDTEMHNFGRVVSTRQQQNDEYFAGSSLLNSKAVFRIKRDLDTTTDERNILGVNDTYTRSVVDSWGTTDSGHTWTIETTAAEFDVSGTEGTVVANSVNVTRRARIANLQLLNFDVTHQVKISAVATGASIEAGHMFRREDLDNGYRAILRFNTSSLLDLVLIRRVAGSNTTLVTATNILGGNYASGTYYKIRYQIVGSDIKVKGWAAASAEPVAWNIVYTDITPVTKPGTLGLHMILNTGNTNGTITFTWDNLVSNDLVTDIQCAILTKNYNLAAPHLFKRLNWWGADVETTRPVTARITPIVNVAKVTWGFLKNNGFKWIDIKNKQWAFPTGGSIYFDDPIIQTGTSVTRKFVLFVKALRYRQVNFVVNIPSNGTLSEGPCHLYWLSMSTSTKQRVSKKVS